MPLFWHRLCVARDRTGRDATGDNMAHSTDLQRTNTTVFDGLRTLAKASLAALAGGVLLSGAAMAQVTVQPTVYDFTPIVSSPGDLEPGDTLQVEFTISADAPVFVEDNLDGTSDWTSTVYSAMSTSVSLSGLGSGAEVVTFSGTTGASGGVATLINGNCNGTGPSFGASTASWSSMDTGSVFFNSFSAPTCTVAVTFKLPDDIAPGAYTLNFGSLTGVQRTADILADGSNPAFFFQASQ